MKIFFDPEGEETTIRYVVRALAGHAEKYGVWDNQRKSFERGRLAKAAADKSARKLNFLQEKEQQP